MAAAAADVGDVDNAEVDYCGFYYDCINSHHNVAVGHGDCRR